MIAYTAISSDIKFFVTPNSVIDLDVVVGSERGSFHTGEAKDITVLSLDKQADFMVAERLEFTASSSVSGAAIMARPPFGTRMKKRAALRGEDDPFIWFGVA